MNWKKKIAHELENDDCPRIGKGRLSMNWKMKIAHELEKEDCP
jgi:hypothetical protein